MLLFIKKLRSEIRTDGSDYLRKCLQMTRENKVRNDTLWEEINVLLTTSKKKKKKKKKKKQQKKGDLHISGKRI
jgi:hypothetical protein